MRRLLLALAVFAFAGTAKAQQAACEAHNYDSSPENRAEMGEFVVEAPLSLYLYGGVVLAREGWGGTVATRVEWFADRLFLGGQVRANIGPMRAYLAEALVGWTFDHSYGTAWAGEEYGGESSEYDPSTNEVTVTTYLIPEHCELSRVDYGVYTGARGMIYDGGPGSLPDFALAATAGLYRRSRTYSSGLPYGAEITVGGLFAPPGFAGDEMAYGAVIHVSYLLGVIGYAGAELAGLFKQYGHLALDLGLMFDL